MSIWVLVVIQRLGLRKDKSSFPPFRIAAMCTLSPQDSEVNPLLQESGSCFLHSNRWLVVELGSKPLCDSLASSSSTVSYDFLPGKEDTLERFTYLKEWQHQQLSLSGVSGALAVTISFRGFLCEFKHLTRRICMFLPFSFGWQDESHSPRLIYPHELWCNT